MGFRVKLALLLLLLLVIIHAGCIAIGPPPPREDQGGQKTPQTREVPIQDITSRNAPKISLGDALATLPAAEQEGVVDTSGMTIRKIWGYGVDSAGLARTWVLGMQGPGRTILLAYGEGAWQVLDLPTTLPQGEVKIAELVTPQDLFRRNINVIGREMNNLMVGECDLTLEQDTYQVTIHSDAESSTLAFNAKTGELMASP
jgi:hypothetical protein